MINERLLEAKPRGTRIYKKDFWTGRLIKTGVSVPIHNAPPLSLPDGTILLTEEEHQRRQSGTGSHAAHVAQADEEKHEKQKQDS